MKIRISFKFERNSITVMMLKDLNTFQIFRRTWLNLYKKSKVLFMEYSKAFSWKHSIDIFENFPTKFNKFSFHLIDRQSIFIYQILIISWIIQCTLWISWLIIHYRPFVFCNAIFNLSYLTKVKTWQIVLLCLMLSLRQIGWFFYNSIEISKDENLYFTGV